MPSPPALERWPRDGIPRRPGAWLTTVARNRAVDRVRRSQLGASKELEVARRWTRAVRSETRGRRTCPTTASASCSRCCHPALVVRGTGGAHPAHVRRHDDVGDRPGLPRSGADDGAAAGPGQAQDPPRRHPLRRAAGPPAGGPDGRRAGGALPPLQRGLLGHLGCRPRPARPDGRGHPPGPGPVQPHARRTRGARACSRSCSSTTPAARRAVDDARRPRRPGTSRTARCWTPPPSPRARQLLGAARRAATVPGPSRSRRRSRPATSAATARRTGPRSPRSTTASSTWRPRP